MGSDRGDRTSSGGGPVFGGWSDAVQCRLYRSIRFKKTHANMGNLFGWIYADQPDEFRNATWQRYIDRLGDLPHESEGEK